MSYFEGGSGEIQPSVLVRVLGLGMMIMLVKPRGRRRSSSHAGSERSLPSTVDHLQRFNVSTLNLSAPNAQLDLEMSRSS
jgi:hypothetical protein